MSKKYQFFISSTYNDLAEERQEIIKAILKLNHIPIGMEMFSANDEEQWAEIKRTIDTSDYFIVIIGHKYGSQTREGISYTEKEYDYANDLGIPIMAFIRNRNAPISNELRDSDTILSDKLDHFIEKASKKMRTQWQNKDDLATEVVIAINKSMEQYKRPGWIRNEEKEVKNIPSAVELKNHERKPLIRIEFNNGSNLKIENYKDSNINKDILEKNFHELELKDVPNNIRQEITQKMLDDYNEKLPKPEEREKYIHDYFRYLKTNETGLPLNIEISNNGCAKANDIIIEIIFPKELLILAVEEPQYMAVPSMPKMPVNPIKEAEKKHLRKTKLTNPSLGSYSTIDYERNDVIFGLQSPFGDIINRLSKQTDNLNHSVDGNSLRIQCRALMHTKKICINDNYKIVALQKGTFEIRGTIICEEYSSYDDYKASIEVVD